MAYELEASSCDPLKGLKQHTYMSDKWEWILKNKCNNSFLNLFCLCLHVFANYINM